MSAARRLGVVGGTFDPIHLGHLAAARVAEQALALDAIVFVPSSQPPHRPDKPCASGYHREQMARLAVAGVANWSVSDAELSRHGVSYTFDTLTALADADGGASRIFFILGADAFAEIATWSRYPAVLDLAHFVVIARSGTSFDFLRRRLPELAARMIEPHAGTGPTVRAADVVRPSLFLIAAETPEVSSTDIRRRASSGEPLTGLVPASVEQYIAQHQLYRSPPGGDPATTSLSGDPTA